MGQSVVFLTAVKGTTKGKESLLKRVVQAYSHVGRKSPVVRAGLAVAAET